MKTQNPYDLTLTGKPVQFEDDKGHKLFGTILGPDTKVKNRIAYMVSRNAGSAVGYYSRALYEVDILLIGAEKKTIRLREDEEFERPTTRLRGDED